MFNRFKVVEGWCNPSTIRRRTKSEITFLHMETIFRISVMNLKHPLPSSPDILKISFDWIKIMLIGLPGCVVYRLVALMSKKLKEKLAFTTKS
jgi:hypothetical protein